MKGKTIAQLIALILERLGVGNTISPTPNPTPPPVVVPVPGSTSAQLVALCNAERAKVGLAPLRSDSGLSVIAQSWANEMSRTNVMSHDGFMKRMAGYGYSGEIVAISESNEQAISQWMQSKGHKSIILDPKMTRSGGGSSGRFYCMDFSDDTGKR